MVVFVLVCIRTTNTTFRWNWMSGSGMNGSVLIPKFLESKDRDQVSFSLLVYDVTEPINPTAVQQ